MLLDKKWLEPLWDDEGIGSGGTGTGSDGDSDTPPSTSSKPTYDEIVTDLTLATESWMNEQARMRRIVYDIIAYRNTLADSVGLTDKALTNYHHAFMNVRYGERITMAHVIAQLEEWALEYQYLDEYSPCIVFDFDDESLFVDGNNIKEGNPEKDLGYEINVTNDPIPVKIGSVIKMPFIDPTWISKEEHVFVGWSLDKAAAWAGPHLSSGFTTSASIPVRIDNSNPSMSEYGGSKSVPEFEPPAGSYADETQMENVTFRQPPDVFCIPWKTPPSTLDKKTIIKFYPVFAPAVVSYSPYVDDTDSTVVDHTKSSTAK